MRRPFPVLAILAAKHRECRDLRADLTAAQLRVVSLEVRLAAAVRERDAAQERSCRLTRECDDLREFMSVINPGSEA